MFYFSRISCSPVILADSSAVRPLYMEVTFSHYKISIMRKCDFHIEGPHCTCARLKHLLDFQAYDLQYESSDRMI